MYAPRAIEPDLLLLGQREPAAQRHQHERCEETRSRRLAEKRPRHRNPDERPDCVVGAGPGSAQSTLGPHVGEYRKPVVCKAKEHGQKDGCQHGKLRAPE